MALNHAPPQFAGVKRQHSSADVQIQPLHKKRRVRRALHHVQNRPEGIELAPQVPIFAQGQLLKSIGTALVLAGFDGVKPSALEMFRAEVEEYMLRFLSHARTSMLECRRTKPTALDFASALALTPNTETASLLAPQLELRIPQDISCPTIPAPDPAPLPAPDYSCLLQPLMTRNPSSIIPKHFPALPPEHAWRQTPVFPKREKDPKKMREKATQEGMLAEQALRKLAAAAKSGAIKAEKRRQSILSGEAKMREPAKARGGKDHEDTFADVLSEMGGPDEVAEMELDGAAQATQHGIDVNMPDSVAVNYSIGHWRRGARRGIRG